MTHATDDASQKTLWIETPEVRVGPVARVAMLAAVDGEYSFTVPDELADRVEPGRRVLVPFGRGRKPQPAFCVAVAREAWTSTLRPVAEVVDDERLLSDGLIELGRWIASYYFCPLGRALGAMVPEAARRRSGYRTVHWCRLARAASSAAGQGDSAEPARLRSRKQQAVFDLLAARPEGMARDALIERAGVSNVVIANMARAGVIEIDTRREAGDAPDFDCPSDEPAFALNPDQQRAVDRITDVTNEALFRVLLLFGVSGSGKTEVYIHAIRHVVAAGRQAILLMPEIALTTQIVDRLTRRLENVAVIHSGLTGAQRSLTFAAIARGQKRVVIGTRSAVFAPCPDLGLIIVDEEQEGSYKNQQSPRFNTRDVAVKRAQMAAIPVVLGSATPSLETWHNSERLDHFERITLPSRVAGLPMPAVDFVDLHIERGRRKGVHLLSEDMERGLREALGAGGQAVLLLNRRGYANYLVCSRCRTPVVCPNCRTNMIFHQTTDRAVCHYCTARMVVPRRCGNASCAGTLVRWGMGTQRLEEELHAKFSGLRVARADADTMKRVADYEEVVRAFHARRIDVLLGTQMIAKGLDFPHVSFVGVVNADTAMAIPDFRAAERTFQLLTQVAGRAGRAVLEEQSSHPPGDGDRATPPPDDGGRRSGSPAGARVVVQSFAGLSAAIRHAANHDYPGFAAHELAIRKRFGWPPFARLARVIVSHRAESEARAVAEALAERIRAFIAEHALRADVLGPQTAPMARLRNLHRYDFQLRAPNASRLMDLLTQLRHADVLTPMTRHTLIDVDPVSLA